MKTKISVLAFVVLLPATVFGISGTIYNDTTWASNVTVTGDVTVDTGVTLTIDSGVTVSFTADSDDRSGGLNSLKCELIIKGELNAGVFLGGVTFTSNALNDSAGDWYGIVCSDGKVRLDYCTIEYAFYGYYSYSNADSTYMRCTNFFNCEQRGVFLNAGKSYINGRIEDITGTSVYGVYVASGADSTTLDGLTINNIGTSGACYGIRVTSDTYTLISGGYITGIGNGASARGLYITGDNVVVNAWPRFDDFPGTGSYAIYAYSCNNLVLKDIDIENTSGTYGIGIYISNVTNVDIQDDNSLPYIGAFDIQNCTGKGISLYNSDEINIKGGIIKDCESMNSIGIDINGSSCDSVLIDSCRIRSDGADYSCYIGIAVGNNAQAKIRRCTIEDFYDVGIASGGSGGVADCGTANDSGKNDIYWNFNGTPVCTGSYVISNDDSDTMNAVYNYFGSSSPSSGLFEQPVDYTPYLTSKYNPKAVQRPVILSKGNIDKNVLLSIEPNPVTDGTQVKYEVTKSGKWPLSWVKLELLDSKGYIVKSLVDGPKLFGVHEIKWDSKDDNGNKVLPGIYLIRLNDSNNVNTCKLIITK